MNEEAFHIAKLGLFNVRLLWDIESQRAQVASLDELVTNRAHEDNVSLPINLLHQATFLQFAYITLVWLWEQAKVSNYIEAFEKGVIQRFQFNDITKLNGPRNLQNPSDFLRLLRNAISHGRVVFEDDQVVFSDINIIRSEKQPTQVAMKWSALGKLSESILFSINDILYCQNLRTGI